MNQHTLQYKKHLIALAISSVLFSSQAFAATESQQQSDKKQLLDLERIVLTGSGGRGQTKLESSVSITTLGAEDLAREAPLGTADLLETVPGFWVEDSGGETNNNVAPRGLRGGEVDYGEPIRLTLSEVGLRYQTAHSHFSGALFTIHFDPLPFTVYRGATSPQHAILINTQTTGVEFEYEYRYNASWQLKVIGV
ncbi:TonB-dependent receptor plug domain-containing protein [Pseudoalteromonas sp. MM17-2]|uniref:TonB-dependent receptor plug domain-containing protein n=1 Tax=Pseudoalteromonas sp. MM17-2 TaxID=2917753 RepID=UPI001EF3FE5F|nr:Plug domain-containing protein [Pseudoalteromonas sp. MM17-2]MCG7545072.1 TonB-dependent receptor plug domain-containing protein [Pseudoalteromonas sp. MM17-2]